MRSNVLILLLLFVVSHCFLDCSLGNNSIGDEGAKAIAAAVKDNGTLTYLK
jgi:hypothetical protein